MILLFCLNIVVLSSLTLPPTHQTFLSKLEKIEIYELMSLEFGIQSSSININNSDFDDWAPIFLAFGKPTFEILT